jgi:hypothetical protein
MNGLGLRHAGIFQLLGRSLIGVSALLGCSTANGTGPGAAGVTAGGAGASSTTSSGAGAGVGGASNSNGNDLNLDVDAATVDQDAATGCSHLNIGILGNPGSNNASNFQQWLTKSGTSVQRIQTTADEPITRATLDSFDVVVVDRLTREYTADEASIFAAWVTAGGGVASMSGYQDDTTVDWRANSLLAPLGVAYAGNRVWGPVTKFATHPTTAGLTSVTFTGGYPVSDLGGVSSTRTPIAFLPGTPEATVGSAIQMGAGHALVWGDEWIEFDSEWSTYPQIPQLWVQVFAWISPQTKCLLDPPK